MSNNHELTIDDERSSKKCPYCGSKDLWDDNLAYGCRSCKAFLGGN